MNTRWAKPAAPFDRAAFTLVEAMVVVMIISVIMGLIVGLYRHADYASKVAQTRAELGEISQALETYYLKAGEYPSVQGAQATNLFAHILPWRRSDSATADTPFSALLPTDITGNDPWSEPYLYRYDTNVTVHSYRLYSLGPDGEESHDDISIQD